jgi:hypothetical protein
MSAIERMCGRVTEVRRNCDPFHNNSKELQQPDEDKEEEISVTDVDKKL